MGLDTTHGAWHGACSAFHRWRTEIARVAGFPPLELMEGFYNPERFKWELENLTEYSGIKAIFTGPSLPIKWEKFRSDPLVVLLHHSDCDGDLTYGQCGKIAKRLRELLPLIDGDLGGYIGNVKEKTLTFIEGCELAHSNKEKLRFH